MYNDDYDNPDLLIDKLCDQFEISFQKSCGMMRLDDFWKSLPTSVMAYIEGDQEFTRRVLVELIGLRLSIDESRGILNSESTVLSEIPQELASLVDLNNLTAQSALHSGRSLFANAYREDSQTLKQGDSFGGYHLVSHLGSGGMGIVWRARQSQPVERDVAIKFIGSGFWNRQMVNRFRRECRAMAMLEHPNIARLFEAGTSETGQPYLIMELVDGPTIIQYAQQQKLSVRQRVELFIPLCHAVQHAHQKGILHRDLKPSNILVATHEGVAQAKIIDLGLAKAVHPAAIESLNQSAWMTSGGQIVGTLDYMSPEQTRLGEADADTRSDVYSLGCVLYELLTGYRPFQNHKLNSLQMEDAIQIIRTLYPVKLSSHDQQLRGELEWIVGCCLEKDRSLRYETASAIADELTRWLDGEPIRRAPPSRLYLTKKFVQRHRSAVIALAGIVAVLCVGLAGTLVSLKWAIAEQARASNASREATIAKQNAEQVLNYVTKAFSRASSLRDGHKTLLVDVLKDSIEQIERDFPEESEIKADIQYAFGETLNGLGQFEKAFPLLQSCVRTRERLLGNHQETLIAKSALLITLRSSYLNASEARKLESELVDQHRQAGTEDSYEGLMARLFVAFRQPSIDDVTKLRDQLLKDHGDRTGAFESIFIAVKHYSYYGDSELMEARYLEARKQLEDTLGPAHRYSLRTASGHVNLLAERNRFREAAEIAKTTYEYALESLSESDHMTLELGSSLGSVLDSGGDYENALIALTSASNRCQRMQLPANDFLWSALAHKIGQAQLGSYRLRDAIPKLNSSDVDLLSRVGTDNLTDVERKHYLLEAYLLAGQKEDASAVLLEVMEMLQRPEWDVSRIKGLRRVLRLKVLAMQAYIQSLLGNHGAAIQALNVLSDEAIALGEPGRRTVRRIRFYLGMILTKLQRYEEAISEFDSAITDSLALDIAPWIRLNIQRERAWALFRAGKTQDSWSLIDQSINEYSELATFDGSIESHPQYRLARLCQSIMQDIATESNTPSAEVINEIEKIKVMIGPESPFILDKLAAYHNH